jgi:hypothetical protein
MRIAAYAVQTEHASWSASHLLWELHRALPVLPADADPVPVLESMAADVMTGRAAGVEVVMLDPSPGPVDVEYLGTRASDGRSIYEAPGRHRYALVDHLDIEEHIIAQAGKARARMVTPVDTDAAVAKASTLNAAQADAMRALLASERAVTLVRAAAGTGKTRLVGEFAKAWTMKTPGRVIAVTVSESASRVAAEEMRQAGAEAVAFNLARFLGQRRDGTYANGVPLYAEDVVVLDEASQVGTRELLRLQLAVDQAGARLVMVFDEYQLSSVEAGGMAATLAARYGAHELHEVMRFNEEWERAASVQLRKGNTAAIADYRGRGRIVHGRLDEVYAGLVLDWAADVRAGREALMITATNVEAQELNRLAREHLARVRKTAGEDTSKATLKLGDGNTAGIGDWIRARQNDPLIDARGNFLANRDTLRVAKIIGTGSDRRIFTERRLPDGSWTTPFEVPEKYLVKSAELGYASTIFSAQGRTVDVGHSLITDGMSREALYVAATRGRMENRLHVVTGANDAERLAEPESVIGGALGRPQADQSAHAVMDEAMDHSDHPAYLMQLFDGTVRDDVARGIDDGIRARLSAEDYGRYLDDPVRAELHKALRSSQLGGADLDESLDAITTRDMSGAHSVAATLHGRLATLEQSPRRQADQEEWKAVPWAQTLPEARAGGPARDIAEAIDDRERGIGERLASLPQPPAWLGTRLGVAPREPGALRDDYVARAGAAGLYRELSGLDDPQAGIGPVPQEPARRVAWERARAALEIPQDDAATKSQAELETRVRGWRRENEAAPRDVADELQRAREMQIRAERQAQEAEAAGDADLAEGSRSVAAEEATRAAGLGKLQNVRDEWDGITTPARERARAAQQELQRRGIDAETTERPAKPEPVTAEVGEPTTEPQPEPASEATGAGQKPARMSLAAELAQDEENLRRFERGLDAVRAQREADEAARQADAADYTERQQAAAQAETEAYAWAPAARVDADAWAQRSDPEAE